MPSSGFTSASRSERLQVLAPFAFVTLAALVWRSPTAGERAAWEELAAMVLTVVLVVAGFAVPWSRVPRWARPTVPMSYFVVIVLLRDSHGGAASGYEPLCILSVLWLALFGTRRQLWLSLVAVALTFGLPPLLIGGPSYPAGEWRTAFLWTIVLAIAGYRVQSLVLYAKRNAVSREAHAAEVEETQAALRTMSDLAREISLAPDARDLICRAAVDGSGASFATMVEPDGRGGFHVTGSAGIDLDSERLRNDVRPSASLGAYYSRERVFLADASAHHGVSPVLLQETGVRSAVFEPILRRGKPVGVLGVGWTEPLAALDERTSTVLSYLAVEAGAAIERADLVAQLDLLARTDQLTGLPNRRSWDIHLEEAIGRADAGPFCVAVIDLDHFKSYNDRYGHQAGDQVLRRATAAWLPQLRTNDLLARFGGEEFAVLLPDCGLDDAVSVLERLRAATLGITCSLGVAEYRRGETAEQVTYRADQALYRAKNGGRDQLRAA